MGERHQSKIDFSCNRLVPDMGMDGIGEIQGSSSLLDGFLLSFRSKDHYVCLNQVIMNQIQQFKGIDVWVYKDILDLGYPFVHLAFILLGKSILFIGPVGSYAFFSNIVHPLGADLHLYPYACVAHKCTVESFIAIVLWIFYPVPDTVSLVLVNACDC